MESSLPSLPTIDFLLEEPPNEHNFTTIQLQKARVFQKQCLEIWMDKYRHVKNYPYYLKIDHTSRFLVHKSFKAKDALPLWEKFVILRQKYDCDNICEDNIRNELKSGKAFIHKHNKANAACIVILVRNHLAHEVEFAELVRFALHLCESAYEEGKQLSSGKFCLIWWREGFSASLNTSKELRKKMKELNQVWEGFYSEKLDSVYITHVNLFFKVAFALAKPFLSSGFLGKVNILSKSEELLKYFSKDCLIKEMGGTSDFQYKYPPSPL